MANWEGVLDKGQMRKALNAGPDYIPDVADRLDVPETVETGELPKY
ncbi:hypothetical protein FDG2_0861 [Candidatus Protofrankia californiensis]|uniref:Uncharacterized protein n=1 Tax=Candidatus Protofrankia californiensis TaxID=1839754 RepID=A0A1C3NUI5_9ACTN|nr:hypothetical protein FDG2_0861 [Candidatus Protofrankia californiensis]